MEILMHSVLHNDPNIKEIDVTVGDDERLRMLCNALRGNRTVTRLLLGYSELSVTRRLHQLSEALEFTKIRSLNLRNCRVNAKGARALATRGIIQSLTILDLRNNELGDDGAIVLSNAIRSKRVGVGALKTLLIGGCDISDEGTEALSGFLMQGLEELDLSANKIGNLGVDALTQVIISMGDECKLRALELRENRIGNEGAISISLALTSSKSIQNLNLSKNNIGSEGCELMAHVLSTRKSLVRLNLHSNQIDDQGANYFLQTLKNHNDKLQYLDLSRNNAINKSTRQAIFRLLELNRSGIIRTTEEKVRSKAKKNVCSKTIKSVHNERTKQGFFPELLRSLGYKDIPCCISVV